MSFDLYSWLSDHPPPSVSPGVLPLTSVERVRSWMNPDQGTLAAQPDATLSRVIRGVSGLVMSAMNRDTLARTTRTEYYGSIRTARLALRSWPAFGLTSVELGTVVPLLSGFSIEMPVGGAQCLVASTSRGATLYGGSDGVKVVYQSGFVKYEDLTIPDTAPYVVHPSSMVLAMEGVIDPVSEADVAYTLRSDGGFEFNGALAGDTVRLIYSYVPEDIEQVVVDEASLSFKSRQRIGESSKALANGAGTVSYLPRKISEVSMITLNNYKNMAPI